MKLHQRDPRYPAHNWPACGKMTGTIMATRDEDVTCGLCLRVMNAAARANDVQQEADRLAAAVVKAQEALASFRADMILAGVHVLHVAARDRERFDRDGRRFGINGVCATCGCPWEECPHA